MKRLTTALAAACALVLVAGAGATGDGLWLFPVSHGTGTVAAWRAQEGENDTAGGANHAVLLEKDTYADANSAAIHVVGLEGLPARFVSLSFEYRAKDGVCNTTDPRWALFVQGASGKQYEVNLGCKLAPTSSGSQSGWLRKTFTQPFVSAQVLRKGGADAMAGRVAALALVFDQSLGHVFVDNIHVQAKPVTQTWTFAGDNGGTNPPGGTPGFSTDQAALLATPYSADEQLTQDELFASLSADEWAQIQSAEATP